jgi:hypothetical protein
MSGYVDKLADRVKLRADDHDVRVLLDQTLRMRPSDPRLAQELELRPDLQAKLATVTGYTPSCWVVEGELAEISSRRAAFGIDPVPAAGDPLVRAFEGGLMGLCCSGGGIRSATFSLGVLQALAHLDLLRSFDYLSSVSGGGYIHQWLAAWLKRESTDAHDLVAAFEMVNRQLIPPPEPAGPAIPPEPIHWLQRYSNYLTPKRGVFSGDTWSAVATWLRNSVLNQVILLSGLFVLMLIPHLLAPPIAAAGANVPASPSVLALLGLVGTVTLVSLMLVPTFFAAHNLIVFWPSASSRSELFNEREVQVYVVLPMLAWALLVTVEQDAPWVAGMSWLLLFLFGLTVAFAGQALQACVGGPHRESDKHPFATIAFAMLGITTAVVIASLVGTAWTLATQYLLVQFLPARIANPDTWRLSLVLGPPLYLAAPLITLIFLTGLLGRTFYDARREWLSRLFAWAGLYAVAWLVVFGVSLMGHDVVAWLASHAKTGFTAVVGWLGVTAGSLIAGRSSKTAGHTVPVGEAPTSTALEWLANVGPYVFILGAFLGLAWCAEEAFSFAYRSGPIAVAALFILPTLACLILGWRVDINEFSMHAFYRNRLARCYLGASNTSRRPNPFTAFDERDAEVAISALKPSQGYPGPLPLFCTALNLTLGDELAWQERKAASFVFSPLYSGFDVSWTEARGPRGDLRFNGYVDTGTYAYPQPGIHIATAASISGAAVSPNSGYHTNPATAFLMTLFNARLGWWLLNPRVLEESGQARSSKSGEPTFPRPSPKVALWYLIKELLGHIDDTSKYVYLSDGGHFDNMGLYELVRRRCRYIVVCDGEEDGKLQMAGIAMAIRKCRADFGAEINLDLRSLERIKDSVYSSRHAVVGTIKYPGSDEVGIVVYIKASVTGDEPVDILSYKKEHSAFPYDTTLDQWFTESQFESYRRLGQHIGRTVFEPTGTSGGQCVRLADRQQYFEALRDIWYPPTPEMEQYQAAHAARYDALLQQMRVEPRLGGLLDRLFDPGDGHWTSGRTEAEKTYARGFCSELLEFIWTVYTDLNLVQPVKLQHPHSQGWVDIFKKWSQVDIVQEGWAGYRDSYSRRFQLFARNNVNLP